MDAPLRSTPDPGLPRGRRWRDQLNHKWGTLRLADRITITSLALTLGMLGLFGTAGYLTLRYSELRQAEAALNSSAQSTRYEVNRNLSRIEDTLAGAAGQTLVANALADARGSNAVVSPFLRDAIKPHGGLIRAIALVDYRGEIISRAGDEFSPGVSLVSLVAPAIASARPLTRFLPTARGAKILFAYPVTFLPTGNVEGAVIAEMVAQQLLPEKLRGSALPYSLEILTESGLPLAAAGPKDNDQDMLRVEVPLAEQRAEAAFSGLRLITKTPRSAALAQLRKLQFLYLLMVALAVAVSVYFSRTLGARIAKPIVALSNAARAATEQGHAAIQDVQVFGLGELGELANTFNSMGRSLAEAHAELEARVGERTRQLREAREQIKDIFDSVAEVVYSSVPDFSRLHFVSASAQRVFGIPADKLVDEPRLWQSMIHPEDRSRARGAHILTMQNGGGEVEYRIRRPDGEIRWVRDRFTLLRDAATHEVLRINGTASDITAAVVADEARLRAEEWLRTLHRAIQASSAGVIITDLVGPDQPVVMVNAAFERITGYSPDEVLGKNCRFLQGPDTNGDELEKLRLAIKAQRECKVILKNYRKDGSTFWNELSIAPVEDTSGRVVQFVGIMNDISPLVDYQHQMVQWAQRLDTVLTMSPDGFVSLDRGAVVTFANPAFERMIGIPRETLVGMRAGNLDAHIKAQADPAFAYPVLDEAQLTRNSPELESLEAVIYLSKPQPLMLKRIVRQSSDKQAANLIYFRDVTREMEVDRMKSEFLNTAAHELRTPMASVMGFSELLLAREFPREVQQEYLGIIHRQSRRLTSLLNDLLDLARIEARRRGALLIAPHPLDEIVRDTLSALMVPGDARAVKMLIAAPLPVVKCDGAKIGQALTNLLSNAYKYSPAGGEITLRSEERLDDDRREIGLLVEDHGIGMTPAQLERAFERFYRADDTGSIPGTGLGLALVKEIIETHGGHVELKSEFGKGTVASIWLPLPM